ncbi:MAG: M48 family metalloprotease [archaeon]|nr:M48 family metalloprotease [archaeon]
MGYKFRSTIIVGGMYAMVFLFMFLIGSTFLQMHITLVAGISLGFIFLQYLISPLIIGWIYNIQEIDLQTLNREYPHIGQLIEQIVQKYNIKPPKFGIIPDGSPNAFCFGWTKNSSRLVITQGILDLLDPDEQNAVVAHEMGHIVHNDFIVMTFISAIPVLFYMIFRVLTNSYRYGGTISSGGGSDEAGALMAALEAARFIISVLSYVMYIIGTFISLLLSRIREYWADEFSALETQKPNTLSTALVKIAYGILQDPTQVKGTGKSQYVRALGIFDQKSAKEVAYASTSSDQTIDHSLLAKAASWDLYTPWAKYFEVLSTHPLAAKRIRALNEISEKVCHTPPTVDLSSCRVEFEKQVGKTAMDEFIVEIILLTLPKALFIGWIILIPVLTILGQIQLENIFANLGLCFLVAGIAQLIQNRFKYSGNFEENEITDLIGNVRVSPIRPVPTITSGYVIGKGAPGLFWSEDVFIRDEKGLMYIDYDWGIGIINTLFGIFKVNKLIDKDVRVIGWYRRGPSPYIQVHRIEVLDGSEKSFGNHKKGFWNFIALFLIALGALLFFVLR